MCKWCEDLRNVQPAKFISCREEEPWLKKAKEDKLFLHIDKDKGIVYCLDKCPVCGKIFDEELYDTY